MTEQQKQKEKPETLAEEIDLPDTWLFRRLGRLTPASVTTILFVAVVATIAAAAVQQRRAGENMMSETNAEGRNVGVSAGLDAPRWIIGDRHPDYGVVQMMGVTGGEAYRWFVDDDGGVSMIPLSMLQASNSVIASSKKAIPPPLPKGSPPNTA